MGQRQPEGINVQLTVESIEAEEQRADDRLELGLDERGFRQGGDDLVAEERGRVQEDAARENERVGALLRDRPATATRAYSPRTRPLRTTMSRATCSPASAASSNIGANARAGFAARLGGSLREGVLRRWGRP